MYGNFIIFLIIILKLSNTIYMIKRLYKVVFRILQILK